jgi:hypothetical protein
MHQRRRIFVVPLIVATGLFVTSCGAGEATPAGPSSFSVEPAGGQSSSATASASAAPTPTARENDRGDLIKEIGQVAGIANESQSDGNWMQFKVTDIKEAVCDSGYAEKPEKGNHLLQVDLEVETKKAMGDIFEESGMSPDSLLFTNDWHAYASNGTTMNSIDSSAAWMCLDSKNQIPDTIGPAEKVAGSVVLEVSDTSGEIAWRPYFGGGDLGWTWAYDLSSSE